MKTQSFVAFTALAVASLLTPACAVEPLAEETATSAEAELASTRALSFTCADWNRSCRQSLQKKLTTAGSKAPEAVLASMDKLVATPGYTHAQAEPGPQPITVCGTFMDVHICCNVGPGITCHVVEPVR